MNMMFLVGEQERPAVGEGVCGSPNSDVLCEHDGAKDSL